MPIEAPISELGLFDLFQLISLTAKRGILRLTDDENRKTYTLYFDSSRLAYIDITDRLKEEMIKRKLIDREEVATLKGNDFIEYIIRKQVIPRNTFKVLFKQVACEVLYSLFIIKSGYFSFKEGDISIPVSLELGMKIENIILEAARRVDEMSKIEKIIPSYDIVIEVSSGIVEMESINLDRMEWKLLSLINGKRTIAGLISVIGDELSVLKSLYGLIMTGIVTEKKIELDDIVKATSKEEDEVKDKMRELGIFWNRKEYEKGIETLTLLKKRYPDDPKIIYELGFYYLVTGRFKKAISEWDSYLLLSGYEPRKREIRKNLELVMELSKKISDREVY